MGDRTGSPRGTPTTASVRLHRDIGPLRRVEPRNDDYATPWLDGRAGYGSLRRLVEIVDPLVLLANLGGYTVTEIVVAADPARSNKVLGISLPECGLGQVYRDPDYGTDTSWRVYVGADFPAGAKFALGLRLEIERTFGSVHYVPGVAIDFTDPAVIDWPDPAEEAPLFDRLLVLTSPDADHLDDWLPALAAVVADDDGLRSRLVADLVAAANRVATSAARVVPAGQLALYAPSRWLPPRTAARADEQAGYIDPFVRLGYAMVQHFMPDPEALGAFLIEETRLGRQSLRESEPGPPDQSKITFRARLHAIEEATPTAPDLLALAQRCAEETRREPADPIVELETWTVPRPGLRSVDLRLTYTEWLLVAAQLGAIDPVSAIGIDAAVADPAHSRGLHPWLPGGLSRHAMHIRGLASSAWTSWEGDRPRAVACLLRILDLIPEEPPTFDLVYAGMPDTAFFQNWPVMSSWTGTELEDTRAMLEELIADEEEIDADAMIERLIELELVLPGLDEYWLQTEPKDGPLDEFMEAAAEFGAGYAEGFLIPFGDDPVGTAKRLWDHHQVHAPYLPLMSTVVTVGALWGAGEYAVTTIAELFTWLSPEAVEQAITAIAELLDSSSRDLGLQLGEATGLMAKESAERLLAAGALGWYAFELGRLLGPLLLDLVLGAVFAAYVVPRLASAAALALRETVDALDGIVDLRRAWAGFSRHDLDAGDGGGGGNGGGDGGNGDGGDGGAGDGDGGDGGNGDGDGDGPGPPPPFDPLARLAEVLPGARAEWIMNGLARSNRDRLVRLLAEPARTDALLYGLGLLSDLVPDENVFRSLIRAYTTSDVKVGVPETLGRIMRRPTPPGDARPPLGVADFELPPPPPSPSVAEIQQRALELIARQADSHDELVELSSPMGPARRGSDTEKLFDLWAAGQEQLARRLVGELELNDDLWSNGQAMPVRRPPGQPRTEGRVRATRVDPIDRPQQVEGWLSRTTGDDVPPADATEVTTAADLGYSMNAAHLFPKQFGGPPELWNLIATSARFNQSWMKWTENRLSGLLREHGEIYLRVDLTWGDSNLPTSITYRAYKRAEHGGPELIYTDEIFDLHPQVPLGKTVVEPRLGEDILDLWTPLLHRVAPEG